MTNFIFGNDSTIGTFKNKIINGNFDIWQRGVSFNLADIYTADRFHVDSSGLTAGDVITREAFTPGQTDVPGNPEFYLKFTFGTAGNKLISQRIEDVSALSGKTITISYYVKSTTSLTNTFITFQIFGAGGSAQVTGNSFPDSATSTWKKFSHTIEVPSVSGKTIGAGSYFNIAIIRVLGASNNSISVAQLQVEEGSVVTNFEKRHIQQELALAQRYYYRQGAGWPGVVDIGGSPIISSTHPVPMRAVPSVSALSAAQFVEFGAPSSPVQSSAGIAIVRVTETALALQYNNMSGLTAKRGITLLSNNACEVNAEL